jgi:hypothetical protein
MLNEHTRIFLWLVSGILIFFLSFTAVGLGIEFGIGAPILLIGCVVVTYALIWKALDYVQSKRASEEGGGAAEELRGLPGGGYERVGSVLPVEPEGYRRRLAESSEEKAHPRLLE